MAKRILTPNLEPPYNLRRTHPSPTRLAEMGETDGIAFVLARLRVAGVVPFATAEDKAAHIAELDTRDAALRDAGEPIPARDPLPDPGPHYIVEESDLPGGSISSENDYFFDGWEWDGSAVAVNMSKARAIHLTEIRKVRNLELASKDITFMRAVEAGDTDAQATIATEKQVLRDIPATFSLDSYADPAALKAAWPTELPDRE